jgi:hypothetical protein
MDERLFFDFARQNQKISARPKYFSVASSEKGLFTQPHILIQKAIAWAFP